MDNQSDNVGGAVTFYTCKGDNSITNCLFEENIAMKSYSYNGGGAIFFNVSLNL